jgi:hypothetical protein
MEIKRRRMGRLRGLLLAVALLLAPLLSLAATPALAAPSCATSGTTVTCTFNYTGAPETWTVPAGVTSATFDLYGAGHSDFVNGKGGRVVATLAVTPGASYQIRVGGMGGMGGRGGFNGGGTGGNGRTQPSEGGGGASDVRSGGFALADRLLVAGGGGGGDPGGGGGGGSSYATPAATGVSFETGVRLRDGLVIISYELPPDTSAPLITPTVSGTLGTNGWYTSDVAVTWSVVDAESAISSQTGCDTQSVTSDTTGVTFTCSASSAGGTNSQSVTIKRDTAAPTITAAATSAPNAAGWYTGDVTVAFSCNDATSGVASCPASQTLTGEGTGISSTAQSVSDAAGNRATSNVVTVQIDRTAPTITAAATSAPNAAGWYSGDVTVAFSCNDNLSGVASCPASQTLSGEGSGISSTAQSVSDAAGNSATSNVVTVKIDRTAPVVSVTGVTNGATYPLGSAPTAGCATTDALSGVATQATLSTSGSGAGSYTATCSGATDNAGNTGSASVSYTVAYPWSGFFQPIDNLPTVNTVKAGQAIPVKFSLGGNYGLNIFAAGYPKVQVVSCTSSAPSDEIEQTVTAGNSSLSYDAASGQYTYTWKTDKSWAGSCRQLVMRLADGTDHTALFRFR